MKIVSDIPDQKASFMMELLCSLSLVKATPVSVDVGADKTNLLAELGTSVDDLNEELAGKAKSRDVYELLDEL